MPKALAALALLLVPIAVAARQQTTPPAAPAPIVIPAEASHTPNPVAPTADSIEAGKRVWGIDCAMCHGAAGNGQGALALDMSLKVPDFTDPATLKDRTDGDLVYIAQHGHDKMPPEGTRISAQDYWNVINYIRTFAKKTS